MDSRHSFPQRFLTRYVLQVSVHVLWKERNDRKHGAAPMTATSLAKSLNKLVRNRCLSFRQTGDFNYVSGLSLWIIFFFLNLVELGVGLRSLKEINKLCCL